MLPSDTFRLAGLFAALHGFVAVGMGAFAAHVLAERLDARALQLVETGARYELVHAVALVAVALLARAQPDVVAVRVAALAFAAGALVFSGTLYGLALGGPRWLGAITPVGGTLLLAGWIAVGLAAWRGAH